MAAILTSVSYFRRFAIVSVLIFLALEVNSAAFSDVAIVPLEAQPVKAMEHDDFCSELHPQTIVDIQQVGE